MGCANTSTSCGSSCGSSRRSGYGYVTIIVLYILLAIILSAFVC